MKNIDLQKQLKTRNCPNCDTKQAVNMCAAYKIYSSRRFCKLRKELLKNNLPELPLPSKSINIETALLHPEFAKAVSSVNLHEEPIVERSSFLHKLFNWQIEEDSRLDKAIRYGLICLPVFHALYLYIRLRTNGMEMKTARFWSSILTAPFIVGLQWIYFHWQDGIREKDFKISYNKLTKWENT